MDLLDSIQVKHQSHERQVQLFVGDLASLPQEQAVDMLVVSAFPDNYYPTRSSLIGALARKGVSVADLARDKAVDLRQFASCWLSRPILESNVHFRRILCFEPKYRGKAPEVVADIFRSIVPIATDKQPIRQIAMPLVAAGNQGESPAVMLKALAEAAVHWLSAGLSLSCIKIVLQDTPELPSLRQVFREVAQSHIPASTIPQPVYQYDVFVSYSQKNKDVVDGLVRSLRQRGSNLRVFLDRLELKLGAAWQQHIFEALERSRRIICVLSPDYLDSRICIEEYHMALIRHRESGGVLLPLYMYSAPLPLHMKAYQYADAREGDITKIAQFAEAFVAEHSSSTS